MNRIFKWIKGNKPAVGCFIAAALIMVTSFAMSGCNLGDAIKHKVPSPMQVFNDGLATVSLNDAPFVMERYIAEVKSSIGQFNAANDRAMGLFKIIDSLRTLVPELIANSGVPLAGYMSLFATGIGGLMLRKPGTSRAIADRELEFKQELQTEKNDSFNKGQDIALEQITKFIQPDTLNKVIAALKAGDA